MVSAASKLVAGSSLPYELGEERTSFAGKTPWRLYAGRSKKLECDVTVFLFELKKGTEAQAELARNAMRRYRTLKHPYCVKCLESGARAHQLSKRAGAGEARRSRHYVGSWVGWTGRLGGKEKEEEWRGREQGGEKGWEGREEWGTWGVKRGQGKSSGLMFCG